MRRVGMGMGIAHRVAWCIPLLGLGLTACFGTEETPFPEGLEPLEECVATAPSATPDASYPAMINLELRQESRYDVVHGRGYFSAPIMDVWQAYRMPDVSADRRTVDAWSVVRDVESGYADSYRIDHRKDDLITVEWGVTWRHGVVEMDRDGPSVVAMRWQKTTGSVLIQRIEGSMVLRRVSNDVTSVELVYRASATGASSDDYIRYMQDLYDEVSLVLQGAALPSY